MRRHEFRLHVQGVGKKYDITGIETAQNENFCDILFLCDTVEFGYIVHTAGGKLKIGKNESFHAVYGHNKVSFAFSGVEVIGSKRKEKIVLVRQSFQSEQIFHTGDGYVFFVGVTVEKMYEQTVEQYPKQKPYEKSGDEIVTCGVAYHESDKIQKEIEGDFIEFVHGAIIPFSQAV